MSFAADEWKTAMALLLAATALVGCAGNGNGLDANGTPVGSGGGGGTPLTADFASIQANVFTPICSKCHIGASAPEGLQLDADHSYALLVGVASGEQPAVLRVEPGDPDSSYIIRKLQGSAGISGEQMPLGGPYLPQTTIDVIRQWVTAGAQKSATSMSLESSVKAVQRFEVTTTSPDNGSIVSMAVPQIVVAFNGDVDSNLLNNTTVVLQKLDTGLQSVDAQTTPNQALTATVAIPTGNPSALVIKPQIPLGNGTYRLTLQGSVANMNAQALGANYSFTFTVDALP